MVFLIVGILQKVQKEWVNGSENNISTVEWYDIWGSCCSEENRREAIELWILFSQTIYFAQL